LSATFSQDSARALSGSDDKMLKLWSVASGSELRSFTGHAGSILSVAFSPGGARALSGSGDKRLKLWDLLPDLAAR
jgi:WD40 repeat protein